MSLKAFHVVFIVASVILTVFFGVWAINNKFLWTAIGSFICAIGLIIYEILFLKKVNV